MIITLARCFIREIATIILAVALLRCKDASIIRTMDEAQWAGSDGTELFQLIRSIGAMVRSIAGQLVRDADGRGGKRGVGALEVVQSTAG